MYPEKPANPTLQAADPWAVGLKAAWLFNEGSGVTVRDYSGNGWHLRSTNVSDGSWGASNSVGLYVRMGTALGSRFTTNSNISQLNMAGNGYMTQTFWVVRRGLQNYQRISSRAGNIMDKGNGPADMRLHYFNGSGWVAVAATTYSGVLECWTFVHRAGNMHTFRNGVRISTLGITGIVDSGQLFLGSNPTTLANEFWIGDFVAAFIHNTSMTDVDIASHYSNPFAAFVASGGGGDAPGASYPHYSPDNTFIAGQVVQRNFSGYSRGAPSPALWDWLGRR